MQTFIEGITVARKYQLQNQKTIEPNEADDRTSFSCESEEKCVTSQLSSDGFCKIVNELPEQVLTITSDHYS